MFSLVVRCCTYMTVTTGPSVFPVVFSTIRDTPAWRFTQKHTLGGNGIFTITETLLQTSFLYPPLVSLSLRLSKTSAEAFLHIKAVSSSICQTHTCQLASEKLLELIECIFCGHCHSISCACMSAEHVSVYEGLCRKSVCVCRS